jgi:hypothetical protein
MNTEPSAAMISQWKRPTYPERSVDDATMADIRHVVDVQLQHHRPFPTVCVDRRWDVLATNDAAHLFLDGVDPGLLADQRHPAQPHPEGIASRITNFDEYAGHLLTRHGSLP